MKEFLAEFDRISKGDVTDEEAGKARGLVKNGAVGAFSGLSGIVGTAAGYVENGAPFETLGEDLAAMEKTTTAALNAQAKTALPLDRSVLVLVGDKATILPQLKEAGLTGAGGGRLGRTKEWKERRQPAPLPSKKIFS